MEPDREKHERPEAGVPETRGTSRCSPAQLHWTVTAGNSSQISDGAGAVLIASREKAEQLGLTPRARFLSFSLAGDSPILMLTAPIPATRRALSGPA